MFFLKKSKPSLDSIIPENYVDIHSHLLFGIDDGAKIFSETLSLTNSLISYGFTDLITTPHTMQHVWDNTYEGIMKRKNETNALLLENNIKKTLRVASEYLLDDNFVKRFQSEPLLTLKENYVLVEMSYINPPMQLYTILFDLQVAGYKPVLAHPERYLFFHDNFNEYIKLKKAGCFFQLNLLSVVGYYGEKVFITAKKLLESGMFDYVGSDVHHNNHVQAFTRKVNIKDLTPLREVMSNNSFFKLY